MANSNQDNKQPSPIKEYIKETDTVSRPTAVFFTLIIFFVGAAVAFSLFWGGRWVYDRIANNGSDKNPVTETSSQSTQKSGQNNGSAKTSGQSSTQSTGSANTQNTTTANTTSNATPNTGPTETPNTGPTEVPNTGPMPE